MSNVFIPPLFEGSKFCYHVKEWEETEHCIPAFLKNVCTKFGLKLFFKNSNI
jgi:hypothetical protein